MPELSNILLVDDRPENLLALEDILKQPDRRLFKAQSGNEALRLLLKHQFAVVLLDVQMPEMDGYETAQLMRSDERNRAVPIIFVTAADRREERMFHGYEVGAVDFLYKPVNPRILRSKVGVFVDLERSHARLEQLNGELLAAQVSLKERVADLETLNRTLSHDLRAPLRSIRGFSEILVESCKGKLDHEAEEHLDRIISASNRMHNMLEDLYRLLQLSGAEPGKETTDAESVMLDLLADLGADIQRTGTTISHDPLPSVRTNATLLRQVLQNLIDNAIKFRGPEPPHIHVTARDDGELWCFTVRDNGTGIDPASREKVFGVFERLVGQSVPGSGVGLALCKKAVEKQGGTIWVESTPGQGSAFSFTVPR